MSLLPFFGVLVLLKAQCHQTSNASPLSLTCSRFKIGLNDVILQNAAWQLPDPSRCLLRTFLPEEVLPFSLPDSFPRCVVLGIPLSTYLVRVELLIRGSFTTPRHTFFPTISLVLEQRVFTLCVVYYLFAHLSTPCHSRRGNILGISLLLCSRLNSDPDAHITGA